LPELLDPLRTLHEEKETMMESTLTSDVKDEGFWKEVWRQVRLVWHLLRSPEVPVYLKLVPLAAVVYALIPADIIPDFLPVLGQLDDVTALLVGAKVFIELAPQEAVARHVQMLRNQAPPAEVDDGTAAPAGDLDAAIVIDGDYHFADELSSE
jgi:uncharacterized membrane protein YkvA (DUF1232 family)